ncbi:MAG: hypothetical protein EOM50_01795 [Erysipelotrichia bacterium]|nr:hypothetical protein [Erysipelotrichia bacterium]NCC55553.1 hypothetical protein [Erysipelotrichia bacterium]
MKNTEVKFDNITFNLEKNTFKILGDINQEYSINDIKKCSVLNEDSKFRGKTTPFLHQVLGGTTFVSMLGEPLVYVGVKITMKDESVLGVYVSKEKVVINSNMYLADREEAKRIKEFIDKLLIN